jgi:hypothetical protein
MTAILRRINGHGIGIKSTEVRERLREVRIYAEHGSVQIHVEARPQGGAPVIEVMQYLTPRQAIAVAFGLFRSAWVASRRR